MCCFTTTFARANDATARWANGDAFMSAKTRSRGADEGVEVHELSVVLVKLLDGVERTGPNGGADGDEILAVL